MIIMGGIIQPIVDVFVQIIEKIHTVVGNYGLAIIVMTIFVKLIMLPLTLKQEKSMRRMNELQPKINKLKEKYKDDSQLLNQKIAELYKEENVNPAGGCLPVLIQLPIFIALYRAFLNSSALSESTFLWFKLSSPDSLFTIGGFAFNLLPVLTAVLTLVQQKMMQVKNTDSDSPVASSMQTMLYFMPIMMLAIFYKQSSGLNLYFLTNTILTILQQFYVINRRKA